MSERGFPWYGLLVSWLCAIVLWFAGGYGILRLCDGCADPDIRLFGGLLLWILIVICGGTIVISTVASLIVWLVRRARK